MRQQGGRQLRQLRIALFSRRLSRLAFYTLLLLAPWALARVVQPLPVRGVLSEFSDILFYASDACLLVVVVAWLVAHLLEPERPFSLLPWFVTTPLLLLVGLAFASISAAAAPIVALDATMRLLGAALLMLYVADEMVDGRNAARALAAGMVLQAVLAAAQFGRQGNLDLDNKCLPPGGICLLMVRVRPFVRLYSTFVAASGAARES